MVFDRAEKYAPYIIIPLMTWLLVMWTAPRAGVPAYAGPGSEAELPPPTGWRGAGGKTNANSDFAFDDDVEEGKAAVVAPPAPPPAPCPPPAPAPAAVSTGLTFADASIDKRVKEAVDCLRQHGTYKDGCWWKIRREVTFAVLEYLASLPTDQLDEFSFINSGKTEVSGGYSGWARCEGLISWPCSKTLTRSVPPE